MGELFPKTEQEYGTDYKNHLLEQYKLYVESIEKTSDRRQQANTYFVSINAALITILGFSFEFNIFDNTPLFKVILALVGIIICVVFWHLIRSYKQLNTGKFAVLHKIEENLPVAIYKYEWEILKEGKDTDTYYPFSHIELYVPWIFGVLYLALAGYFLS